MQADFFKNNFSLRILSGIFIVLITLFSIFSSFVFFLLYLVILYSGMCIEWVRIAAKSKFNQVVGCFAIFFSIFSLVIIKLMKGGDYVLLWLFVTIWCYDSFAMIGGKFIGGRKLAESISPKKTWSGVLTGVIFSSLILSIIDLFVVFKDTGNYFIFDYNIIFPTVIFSIFAQLGDLLESFYKRKYKVKDSGDVIPGHGGVLDRYDSFILCSPILLFLMVF
jgi:phosphatidate cytidylyltransferase